jgi:RNA polymerase sigma factor (sigma-70 family)
MALSQEVGGEVQLPVLETHMQLMVDSVRRVQSGRSRPLELDDALQDSYLGLADAAKRYDPDRGVGFVVFAKKRVEGAIIDEERRFHQLGGENRRTARAPSQLNNSGTRSLDAPLRDDLPFSLYDVLPDDSPGVEAQAEANILTQDFYRRLTALTDRQQAVVRAKAYHLTLAEIAGSLAVSERTVSRDWQAARRFILEHFQSPLFRDES